LRSPKHSTIEVVAPKEEEEKYIFVLHIVGIAIVLFYEELKYALDSIYLKFFI
jgi:hypothetical protein